MHIAIATTEFVTEKMRGGQATYLSNISQIFASHGHKVFIVTLSDRDEQFVWKKNIVVCRVLFQKEVKNRWIYRCSLLRRTAQFFRNYFGLSYTLNQRVRELHKIHKIDLVQYSNLMGADILRSHSIPGIVRLSDYSPYWRHARMEKFDIAEVHSDLTLTERMEFMSLRRNVSVFAPSKVVANAMGRMIHKDVRVIESPFVFQEKAVTSDIYEQYLAGKKYLLFFGTLNYLKGIHVISAVLETFLEINCDISFVFLGPDTKLECCGKIVSARKYILDRVKKNQNRVIFLEPIYEKEKANYVIKQAEACVLPSRIDNLPNTCIEAMALGKIVIGTNGASFEQLIEDNISGILCERDKPESLLECMQRVTKMSESEKLEMGERAKRRIELLREDNIYDQMCKLYNKVLNKDKGKTDVVK